MLINVGMTFISEDGPTLEKQHRGGFKRLLDACTSTVLFPQTLHQKVHDGQWLNKWENVNSNYLLIYFPLIEMTIVK